MVFDHAMAGIEPAEVFKTIAMAVRVVPADLHGSKRVVICWDSVPKKLAERGWVAGLSADQFFAGESRTRS
jgi:hypothetical protein